MPDRREAECVIRAEEKRTCDLSVVGGNEEVEERGLRKGISILASCARQIIISVVTTSSTLNTTSSTLNTRASSDSAPTKCKMQPSKLT